MHVRMYQTLNLAAGPAAAAGLRAGLLAEELLSQPEGQSLLAHPCRSDHDEDLRQSVGPHRVSEPLSGLLMADESMHRHRLKVGTVGWKR
jgi:hypothetical protein